MAIGGSIDGERRRHELVEMARRDGDVSIEGAAELFGVSSMTIRRDLATLEADGQLRRVRGGAIASAQPRSYDDRLATHADAKGVIARKALALIPDEARLSLDASTTVNAIAAGLGAREGLVASTNSVQTFEVLSRHPGVEAMLTGGVHEPVTGSLVGPIADSGARSLVTDWFVTSAAALDPVIGTSEVSLAEAAVKYAFASRASATVLCLDASKLDRRSVGSALDIAGISVLITELDPEDARLDAYRVIPTIL